MSLRLVNFLTLPSLTSDSDPIDSSALSLTQVNRSFYHIHSVS